MSPLLRMRAAQKPLHSTTTIFNKLSVPRWHVGGNSIFTRAVKWREERRLSIPRIARANFVSRSHARIYTHTHVSHDTWRQPRAREGIREVNCKKRKRKKNRVPSSIIEHQDPKMKTTRATLRIGPCGIEPCDKLHVQVRKGQP